MVELLDNAESTWNNRGAGRVRWLPSISLSSAEAAAFLASSHDVIPVLSKNSELFASPPVDAMIRLVSSSPDSHVLSLLWHFTFRLAATSRTLYLSYEPICA